MTWKAFCLTYELHSPLHIGFHKVGNVQRTRYYLPSRNLWGAVTECLTRSGFSTEGAPEGNYAGIGRWVKGHCAFGYFFLWDGATLFQPRYTEQGLRYWDLDTYAFERRYLDSHVTTALNAATTSAESGSLHEVEIIRARNNSGGPVQLHGWVFLDDKAQARWTEIRMALDRLQVGGERRYGLGQLRLANDAADRTPDECEMILDGERPQIRLKPGQPLGAHALVEGVEARGQIEPLVGRETSDDSARFGTKLTEGRVCWVPGSVVNQKTSFEISGTGIWGKIP